MSTNNDQTKTNKRPVRTVNHKASAQQIERGIQFLSTYFTSLQAQVKVSVQNIKEQDDSQEVIFKLTGHLNPLKRNPLYLSSLTRLTSMAMSAQSRHFVRCALDLDGHLSARRELLEVIAEDAAAVAKHTHKRAIIEGLSSFERRKVHNVVSQDAEVETLSDGEGEFRYMMVAIKT